MEEQFVGKRLDVQAAKDRAEHVVVGELLDPGLLETGPPGELYHYGARIRVIRSLSGALSGEQVVVFKSTHYPGEAEEKLAASGQPFVFFIEREANGGLFLTKMVPATSPTVRHLLGGSG